MASCYMYQLSSRLLIFFFFFFLPPKLTLLPNGDRGVQPSFLLQDPLPLLSILLLPSLRPVRVGAPTESSRVRVVPADDRVGAQKGCGEHQERARLQREAARGQDLRRPGRPARLHHSAAARDQVSSREKRWTREGPYNLLIDRWSCEI